MNLTEIPDLQTTTMAIGDLGVRLAAISDAIDHVARGSAAAMATTAGSIAAGHLPHSLYDHSVDSILKEFADSFADAWDIGFKRDGDALKLTIGDCVIRDVCKQTGRDQGGSLCKLFYGYLVGYMVFLADGMTRGSYDIVQTGDDFCVVRIELR